MLKWFEPRPPKPTMATLILSFAPHTREAAAAVTAPRKNLRDVVSVIRVRDSFISTAMISINWRKTTAPCLRRRVPHCHWKVMSIFIVRLGAPRKPGEGLRLGTVRRPPRGVPKSDFAKLDYYDVWFPNLSPSAELVKQALGADSERSWSVFKRKFRREMSQPDRSRDLDVLAALSHQTNLSLGCYCELASRCHRSVLRELLAERGADVV
jgi:uncharacterized protein YeaO (DUF488 family)